MRISNKIRNKNKARELEWLKNADLNQFILSSIGLVGMIGLLAVAPNVIQLVGLYQKYRKKYKQRYYINERLEKLVKDGFIIVVNDDGEKKLELTAKGENFLEKGRLLAELDNKKWDKKWRIVIFDIWEKRRKVRDQLRMELIGLGFQKMQNSVWITPYDCGDYVYLLKTDLMLGPAVIFFEVTKIENEKYWRQKFDLKL